MPGHQSTAPVRTSSPSRSAEPPSTVALSPRSRSQGTCPTTGTDRSAIAASSPKSWASPQSARQVWSETMVATRPRSPFRIPLTRPLAASM